MNTRAFALVNDLLATLPRYQAARDAFQQLSKDPTNPAREQALGEVIVQVHEVVETIKRHKDALA